MWASLASFILRNRTFVLIAVGLLTVFMALQSRNVKMTYKFGGLLPETDTTYQEYQYFLEEFSEDGNVLLIGLNDERLHTIDNFRRWYDLGDALKEVSITKDSTIGGEVQQVQLAAVDSVFSSAHVYTIVKDTAQERFAFERLLNGKPESQEAVDAVRARLESLPFYEDILYQDSSAATLMMVFVNSEIFNSEDRGTCVEDIVALVDKFSEDTGIQAHISGMPYIRTELTNLVKQELGFFVLLAAFVTAFLLFLFFRNLGVMAVCMLVVGIGVVTSLGTIGLLEYRISMLMGLIPPLMIVIGVPNCIYLLNKYHSEFKKHGNKAKSLTRVVQRIGNATFMTNTTTALGFATFIFTESDILREFGVVAAINIMAVFFISIFTIPAIFSFLPAPKRRHVRHLDRKWVFLVVNKLVNVVEGPRKWVYGITIVVLGLSIYGITLMQATGNIVGDLPSDARVIQDLEWFEDEYNGVMPFEVLINTHRPNYVTRDNFLRRVEKMQKMLAQYPDFSRSLSLVDASKFAKQAYYNGNPAKYALIRGNEKSFIGPYLKNQYETGGVENTFLDSARSITRVTAQVADIGTIEMKALLDEVRPRMDSIFNPRRAEIDSAMQQVLAANASARPDAFRTFSEDVPGAMKKIKHELVAAGIISQANLDSDQDAVFTAAIAEEFPEVFRAAVQNQHTDITITGTSIVFLEGTRYMVKNLLTSLVIAICVIALIMAMLFRSSRMVLISLLPNLIPLLFTGGVMGWFGIPLKPSTILVFSIAFGISVDDTIHFLAKYRQELKHNAWNIRISVLNAVKETGVSMMYTSIVLFFGFGIFGLSEFDGTKALGVLVSVTLLVAMFTNLLVLPSLLLSFNRWITTQAFKEPLLELIDEEEDIELHELQVKPGSGGETTPL